MTPEEMQRKEELEWAARFFHHHFGYVPEFEDLPTNSRPDVCVQFEGKRIGIELTRAVDPAQAVFDSFSAGLLGAASVRHAELGGLHGRVTVSLLPKFDPGAYHRKTLGAELGQIVASLWKESDGVTIIKRTELSPAYATWSAKSAPSATRVRLLPTGTRLLPHGCKASQSTGYSRSLTTKRPRCPPIDKWAAMSCGC